MKTKSIGIVVGALLAITGLIVGGGGAAVLATIGTDGKVSTGDQSFDTSGAALVTSAADMRRPEKVSDIVGDPRVQLGVHSAKSAFVGVGPAKDVERYLKGAPVDEVTDFEVSPFKMKHDPRAGSRQLAPPAKQTRLMPRSRAVCATPVSNVDTASTVNKPMVGRGWPLE